MLDFLSSTDLASAVNVESSLLARSDTNTNLETNKLSMVSRNTFRFNTLLTYLLSYVEDGIKIH